MSIAMTTLPSVTYSCAACGDPTRIDILGRYGNVCTRCHRQHRYPVLAGYPPKPVINHCSCGCGPVTADGITFTIACTRRSA